MKKHSATIRDRLPGCLIKWLEEKTEANAQNENAMQILKEAIKTAANDPMMTAEVKELADTIILLIEDRNLIDYTFDGIMEPVVKIVTSDTKSLSRDIDDHSTTTARAACNSFSISLCQRRPTRVCLSIKTRQPSASKSCTTRIAVSMSFLA